MLSAPGYAIPDRIREHVILRDRTCVFPWCTRPARGCDVDHITPYDHTADTEGRPQPGPTTTTNLAALCRFHHRLKTHTAWRYEMVEPGVYEWMSPHGHRFRRDQHRQHRTGPTRPGFRDRTPSFLNQRDGSPPPTMTPPHTPPPTRWRGHRHVHPSSRVRTADHLVGSCVVERPSPKDPPSHRGRDSDAGGSGRLPRAGVGISDRAAASACPSWRSGSGPWAAAACRAARRAP